MLLLPAAILLMARVRRHYRLVTRNKGSASGYNQHPPIVIVPIDRYAAAQKTLRFAMTLSPDVHAVHVACGGRRSQRSGKTRSNSQRSKPERPFHF